jgi:hypothetical protein
MPLQRVRQDQVADTESTTPASHADTERQNARASDHSVAIARTSKSLATTLMANGIESRSRPNSRDQVVPIRLTCCRQFGTMTEKVSDYEKLLRDLATRVSEADASLIKSVLEKVSIVWSGLMRC